MRQATPYQFEQGEVLLIDKPLRWTSFDVVKKIRNLVYKYTQKKIKIGHAGTLDPLATGLLIVCTGKMTKQIDSFQAQDKIYIGELCLGKTTPSYDAETEPNASFDIAHITETKIYETTKLFLGEIWQYPPIFSAIKQTGEPLYKLARKGKDIVTKARPVRIDNFEITQIALPYVRFKVKCSKGTYIRSLAHDFGRALNAGAYLTALRRTHIGNFSVENALTIEQLTQKLNT
ncbi:MAG: tRNA pseudouridine(55) synthase TruB [Microscillaceae bacterium]|nr:tRNA pseudouridine(55) synthase TruB [Microscillaceae bacterium]MDW8460321.1 tRNA pseudouridine(55) synthase TruB [Cytophagales bacterium]